MLKAKDLKQDSLCLPSKVCGIDFSGAKKAGNKIWIASATISGNAILVEDCYRARDLPDSAAGRDQCLGALRSFIGSQKACAFGLDFPFSLPTKLIKANRWEDFVLSFADRYSEPEKFRAICWEAAGNREKRRDTDEVAKAPFSPYNRRLYRQTYYGIRDVLAPLVKGQVVSVLPMQSRLPAKPWLLEVCPASTLRRMGLYHPYKGHNKGRDKRGNRAHILEEIESTRALMIKHSALRTAILDDSGGDALDSVIAAFATFRAIGVLANSSVSVVGNSMLEGYIYI